MAWDLDTQVKEIGACRAPYAPKALAALRDLCVQAVGLRLHPGLEVRALQRTPQHVVLVLAEGAEVEANRAREEDGLLRDDRELAPEVAKAHAADVQAVDGDAPAARLHDAKQREKQATLAGACTTADTDLL